MNVEKKLITGARITGTLNNLINEEMGVTKVEKPKAFIEITPKNEGHPELDD